MKLMKYLLIPFAFTVIHTAHANNVASAKQLSLPFNNEPIFSESHTGLFFSYDMKAKPTKKIVCDLTKVYKGWVEFRDEGNLRESHVYGNGDSATLVLTSKGKSMDDQYHADATGSVKINALKGEKGNKASASCHYEVDDNSLR